jgi:hypothetical protein
MSGGGKRWTRNNVLAGLIAERGLSTKGFKKALRELIEEYVVG